jgi:F-type H+-transporting ATPase subunit epsilon
MNLAVLVPFRIFAQVADVARVVVETRQGSYGLLPHRLDCVAALGPGILTYASPAGIVYVALDEGVVVKSGQDVRVSVRRAIGGTDLGQLRAAVLHDFLERDTREQNTRAVLAKLDGALIEQMVEFQRDR